jgi:hypothetical protein
MLTGLTVERIYVEIRDVQHLLQITRARPLQACFMPIASLLA